MNKYVPKRLLVVKNRAMGDAVISLGTLQYLREIFPEGKIYYGTPKWVSPLFHNMPTPADEILPLELNSLGDWWRLFKELRLRKVDCIFEMFQSGRTRKFFNFYSKIFNIPYYAHNHHKKTGEVFDQGIIKSNIQRDLDGAWSFFGGKEDHPNFLQYEPKSEITLKKERHLIIGVVATRETKKWELKNYVEIIERVKKNFPDWKISIPLSPSAEDQGMKKTLKELGIHDSLFLEVSLKDLPSRLSNAALYLGNDTGIKHLCIALGTKSFTLFGPEPPTEWHPYDEKKHPYFFIPNLECRTREAHYCGLNTCDSMICLKEITPDLVWEKVKKGIRMFYVYGLGYIGTVMALKLAHKGFKVQGLEIVPEKLESLKKYESHIFEPGLKELLSTPKTQHNLSFTNEITEISDNSVIFLCVGTPAKGNGEVELSQLKKVLGEVGEQFKGHFPTIVLRSTVPPGTCDEIVLPILEKHLGKGGFHFYYWPEFLREGSALSDWDQMKNLIVAGKKAPNPFIEFISSNYHLEWVDYKTAESIKYLLNTFRAMKVSFVNESASVFSSMGVNVDQLFKIFQIKETEGQSYLQPGFSFGGTCLTKEVKALDNLGQHKGKDLPLIKSIIPSNFIPQKALRDLIEKIQPKKVLFCGVTFKPGTDDIRESPILNTISYFQNRPSYTHTPNFFYFDRDEVQQNIKTSSFSSFLKQFENDFSDWNEKDLILLGTNLPEDSLLQKAKEKGVQLVNLGWHSSKGTQNLIDMVHSGDFHE